MSQNKQQSTGTHKHTFLYCHKVLEHTEYKLECADNRLPTRSLHIKAITSPSSVFTFMLVPDSFCFGGIGTCVSASYKLPMFVQ